jgi:hypothetical protein
VAFRLLVGTARVLDALAELYPEHLPGDQGLQRAETHQAQEADGSDARRARSDTRVDSNDSDSSSIISGGDGIGRNSSRNSSRSFSGEGGAAASDESSQLPTGSRASHLRGRGRSESKEGTLGDASFGPRSLADNVVSPRHRRHLRLAMLEVIYAALTASGGSSGAASAAGLSLSATSASSSGPVAAALGSALPPLSPGGAALAAPSIEGEVRLSRFI